MYSARKDEILKKQSPLSKLFVIKPLAITRVHYASSLLSEKKYIFTFKHLRECPCWWTTDATTAHVVKLTEIVSLWVYFTVLFGFTLIWHVWDFTFQFLNYFLWQRITDEGPVPEMRIWSILLIKSDLNWSIHLIRSLFSHS